MSCFAKFMASELEYAKKYLNKYKIKTIENSPPGNNTGCGKRRVIYIRKNDEKNLEIIWSYDNYIK